MNDLEIKNASIIDGLGNDTYKGNLYIKDGKIVAITHKETLEAKESINANGKIITPGFIDSHSHPIFIGNRSTEYKKRASGITYQEIYNAGGGILSSITKLRTSTEKDLYLSSYNHIKEFINGTVYN